MPGVATSPVVGEKKRGALVEIVILVGVSLVAVAGIAFAVYFYLQWDEVRTNVDGRIAEETAIAREDERRIAEDVFAEREKRPFLEFAGPSDYGTLSFMYPRTWSVFVEKDARNGGDFVAYFNPVQVNPVGQATINALRLTIHDRPIETVRTTYDNLVRSGKLTMSVFRVGDRTGDRYDGAFNNDIVGSMVMLKINDKTAILRTDAEIFRDDFEVLIQTIRFN